MYWGKSFKGGVRKGNDGTIGVEPTTARNKLVTSISWCVFERCETGGTQVFHAKVHKADGYRFPTNNEWEMSARWLETTAPISRSLAREKMKTTVNGCKHYWTPNNYGSGIVKNVKNLDQLDVAAWYCNTSNGSKNVRGKSSNVLGMNDLSSSIG